MFVLHDKLYDVAHPGHIESLNNTLREDKSLIYKIHGDIEEPEQSIILTKEQYDNHYNSNTELIQALKRIFLSKQLLFLGCSLQEDRPLKLLSDVLEPGIVNYAIMEGYSKQDCLKNRRIELENKHRIQAIFYPSGHYECVRIILEKILNSINIEENKLNYFKSKLNLSNEWFKEQNEIQIKNLGNRYLPELNVELNIKNVFDGIARNNLFYSRFSNKSNNLIDILKRLYIKEITDITNEINIIISGFLPKTVDIIDIDELCSKLDDILKIFENKQKEVKENELYIINNAIEQVNTYIDYLNSEEVKSVNTPFILIQGEGGVGKSHLIADTVDNRKQNGFKSILLLGQHFKGLKNPLNEMLDIINISCDIDIFLNELNSIAEEDKSRIIIFIDALNEGNGKEIWKSHLPGIIEKLKKYPWIGIVMSIRSEYTDLLIDDNKYLKENLIMLYHKGFNNVEYEAIKKYFDFYKIKYSELPFLNEEFRRPLFLRLFCESYKNNSIDLNMITIMDIYKNYLETINLRISEKLNYSRYNNIVKRVIRDIVIFKYEDGYGSNFISLEDINRIITNIEKEFNIQNKLLDELLSEGIITKNLNFKKKEYFYVTYERLEDYIYSKILIDELKQKGLKDFANEHNSLIYNIDILKVLSISLIEETKYEIFDVYYNVKKHNNIIMAFIESLKWRSSNSITSRTLEYINDIVLKSEDCIKNFYEAMISISIKNNHKLNDDYIIDKILELKMPDRDAYFIPLFDYILDEKGNSINRLLDWCISDINCFNLMDETIKLAGLMISAFLISSNRYLRDKSTKALVNLLTGHIDILIIILENFKFIDDPYVLERLYAVVFGCIVSEHSNAKIEKLAKYVYNIIFETDNVYPNILLRDYAKNSIDYAKFRIGNLDINMDKIESPYKSIMPQIPTDEEIEKYRYDYNSQDFQQNFWSQNAILNSMEIGTDYGDFGRYIFENYFSAWKNLNCNDLKKIAIKKVFNMGYDVKKHGYYDLCIHDDRNDRIGIKKRERIGKKYQWIALYELAA